MPPEHNMLCSRFRAFPHGLHEGRERPSCVGVFEPSGRENCQADPESAGSTRRTGDISRHDSLRTRTAGHRTFPKPIPTNSLSACGSWHEQSSCLESELAQLQRLWRPSSVNVCHLVSSQSLSLVLRKACACATPRTSASCRRTSRHRRLAPGAAGCARRTRSAHSRC